MLSKIPKMIGIIYPGFWSEKSSSCTCSTVVTFHVSRCSPRTGIYITIVMVCPAYDSQIISPVIMEKICTTLNLISQCCSYIPMQPNTKYIDAKTMRSWSHH